jgi:hypothetical protein
MGSVMFFVLQGLCCVKLIGSLKVRQIHGWKTIFFTVRSQNGMRESQ